MVVCKAQDAEDVWFIANNLSKPYAIRKYKKILCLFIVISNMAKLKYNKQYIAKT